MWRTSGYPLKIDNVAADDVYLGWKDMLAVRNSSVISLRTGKVLSEGAAAVDDCSLSRDQFAILREGTCRIHGLYEEFEHEVVKIDGALQVSMMANSRLALRTADEVFIHDYGRGKTMSWQLRCSQIAAGFDHVVALSSEGKVYMFGDGSRGQQGSGDLCAAAELVPLIHLEDLTIVSISAGGWHSAALSDRGYLYQWGWNQHGQSAGLQGESDNVIALPKLRDVGKTVRSVQCGSRHTVVLTDDGKLHSWGWNDFGQCSKLKQTCCVESAGCTRLKAGFWTTAYQLCESCSRTREFEMRCHLGGGKP